MQNGGPADGRGGLGTVSNAVLLLDLLSRGPAYQQLTDLAERSDLSVPTVHRLLRSLVLADLVEQDPRSSRYGLGPELTRLSHQYLARLPILGSLAPTWCSFVTRLARPSTSRCWSGGGWCTSTASTGTTAGCIATRTA